MYIVPVVLTGAYRGTRIEGPLLYHCIAIEVPQIQTHMVHCPYTHTQVHAERSPSASFRTPEVRISALQRLKEGARCRVPQKSRGVSGGEGIHTNHPLLGVSLDLSVADPTPPPCTGTDGEHLNINDSRSNRETGRAPRRDGQKCWK